MEHIRVTPHFIIIIITVMGAHLVLGLESGDSNIFGRFFLCPRPSEKLAAIDYQSACQSPFNDISQKRQLAEKSKILKYVMYKRINTITGFAISCRKTKHVVRIPSALGVFLDREGTTVSSFKASVYFGLL